MVRRFTPLREDRCHEEPIVLEDSPETQSKAVFQNLPGEIRNRIMVLALVPGHIYLSPKTTKDGSGIGHASQEAFKTHFWAAAQLLATCRQLYNEGHEFLYACNTFHLPPGSLKQTREAFGEAQAKHLALIRHATLRFSLHDVDRRSLENLRRLFNMELSDNPPRSDVHRAVLWAGTFTKFLVRRWDRKIQYLKATLPGLESVCFEIRTQVRPLKTLRLVFPGPLEASLDGTRSGFADRSNWLNHIFGLQEHYEWKLHTLMQFVAKQAYTKVLRDVMGEARGRLEIFVQHFNAEYVADFDKDILGCKHWSRKAWSVYGPAIKAFKESDDAISPYNPLA